MPNIPCEKQAFILLNSLLSRIYYEKENVSGRVAQVKKRTPEHRLFKESKI